VDFEWDDAKDLTNRRNHSLGFGEAAERFESGVEYLEIFDLDHSESKDRFIVTGPIARGLIVVVYTEPEEDTVRTHCGTGSRDGGVQRGQQLRCCESRRDIRGSFGRTSGPQPDSRRVIRFRGRRTQRCVALYRVTILCPYSRSFPSIPARNPVTIWISWTSVGHLSHDRSPTPDHETRLASDRRCPRSPP
jgi:uncharacterized DUF497 family protein